MLYVSTRSKTDTFTAYRALHEQHAPDGGMYVPFYLPDCKREEIRMLKEKSFGEIVSRILNLFFSANIKSWDIDCLVGRNPVSIQPMNHKILIGETWHNPDGSYTHLREALFSLLPGKSDAINAWARIVIDTAVLFGVWGEASRQGYSHMDISVDAANFSAPLSAYYARSMGLPLGNIICCFEENSEIWNFFHHGELNTAGGMPENLERYVYTVLGSEASGQYLTACRCGSIYRINELQLQQLKSGFFGAVIGCSRPSTVIASVYRANGCIIGSTTALPYGGLQDYRSRVGESRTTLLFANRNPADEAVDISKAIGIPAEQLFRQGSSTKE